MIRRAVQQDIPAVAAIYDAIHGEEEAGRAVIGWVRGIYPTQATAQAALEAGSLCVLEEGGEVVAAAKIDGVQVPEYADCPWAYPAQAEEVLVLHTLVVHPAHSGRGHASAFVKYYEDTARRLGRPFLRMDTNEKNTAARRLYAKLGYAEVGIVDCTFNGIPGVRLVCLEKKLQGDGSNDR